MSLHDINQPLKVIGRITLRRVALLWALENEVPRETIEQTMLDSGNYIALMDGLVRQGLALSKPVEYERPLANGGSTTVRTREYAITPKGQGIVKNSLFIVQTLRES